MNAEQISEIFVKAATVDRKLPDTARPARTARIDVGKKWTRSKLMKVLSYNPGSGRITWKRRPINMFNSGSAHREWNNKYAGQDAFTCIDSNGYRRGGILGRVYYGHRVAWLLHYGKWPKNAVTPINGDRSDIRIANLKQRGNG